MNRPRILWIAVAMMTLALLLGACAERKNPADSPITAHPASWMDSESEDFHGERVARDAPQTCTSCHGSELMGDAPAPSCYLCHAGPSGHPEDYAVRPEPFHADTVAVESNDACADCHGEDYRGGWAEDWAADPRRADCYYCHGMGPSGHPSGWLTPSAQFFHGNDVRENGGERCTACHGEDFMGGTSGVSCYNACHDGPGGHPEGWLTRPSPFHGSEVIDNGSEQCFDCHTGSGENWTGYACSDCH